MAIKITYHGPYTVPRKKFDTGGFDLKKIKKEMEGRVASQVQKRSGVYIYLRQTRGLEARYVGVNTNGNLLNEAMRKSNLLSNYLLPNHGTSKLLLLECKKPKAMSESSFKYKLVALEDYLIVDLTLKGHDLVNKRNMPRHSKFDFSLSSKSGASVTFKRLVKRKGTPHI